jgi:hypothetical protein
MDLEGLATFKEHQGHHLIHLVQVQEEPNSRLVRLLFLLMLHG